MLHEFKSLTGHTTSTPNKHPPHPTPHHRVWREMLRAHTQGGRYGMARGSRHGNTMHGCRTSRQRPTGIQAYRHVNAPQAYRPVTLLPIILKRLSLRGMTFRGEWPFDIIITPSSLQRGHLKKNILYCIGIQ